MAAYRLVYDSRHLRGDCKEPGSASEPYDRQLSMGYLFTRQEEPHHLPLSSCAMAENCAQG